MLDKRRTAIIFTANTPHLAHANLMIDSLLDKDKGNFKGDIWVISTELSIRAKNYLDSCNIKYLVNELNFLYKWESWKKIAKAQVEYQEFIKKKREENSLVSALQAYRNKRMSKLIILDWYNKFGNDYDFVVLGDNDLFFQKDVHELFEKAYDNDPSKVYYWQEEREIDSGSWLWNKDFHYSRYYDVSDLDFGLHEINIGFVMGKPEKLFEIFNDVKDSFFSLNPDLFIEYSWHDQDLVRLNRAEHAERYTLFEEGDIVHLCNGGEDVVEERYPLVFYHKKAEVQPYVIHFAGGLWKKYPSIKDTYLVDENIYFYSKECERAYDSIRKGSLINIFDEVSQKYFTEENKRSRTISRTKWLDIVKNGKRKFMFIGWLQTGTHKSTYEALPGLFDNERYNLAVLNGNVAKTTYDKIVCEDFPIIISELTRITLDINLIRIYGIKMNGVPDSLFCDSIKSAIAEYRCSEKAARAVANLVYLYFSEALNFYRPDLVMLWGFLSPWGKMIKNICDWRGIPICSLEWGILPGTVAFDFCGHMADSWITKNSEYFNNLSIEKNDIEEAKNYLKIADRPELCRNIAKKIADDVYEYILQLKRDGKKIILYMESNSAHSGNMLYDNNRAKWHSPFFDDDCDAYASILALCKRHSDWHIVYKPHPISLTRGIRTKIDENCTTVIKTGGLNEILELSDMSITILSQGAYVSLIKNVPVLLLGRLQLNSSGAAYTLSDVDDIEISIERALTDRITEQQRKLFLEHVARVLKYYVYSANPEIKIQDSTIMGENLLKILDGRNTKYYQFEREAYIEQKKVGEKSVVVMPIVSVIMPVYNAQEYLAESISSVLNQTLYEIELICINNGSSDDSQMILDYYKAQDSRIIIHYQEEPNQRIARNWGINNAKGKYIYLIDSDDYIDSEALRTLVDIAEERSSDLLYFFFREVRTDMDTIRPRPRYYNYRKFFPKDKVFALTDEYYKFFIQYPFPWAKLMRRDFILSNLLFFDDDCSNFDDNPHNLKVLLSAKRPYVYNQQLYNFRIHNKSMTQSKNPRIIGMIDAVRIMNQIYKESGNYSKYQKWYVPYKIHLIAWAWDLLPDNLKEDYYYESRKLFDKSDLMWFQNDEIWSYYEMPSSSYVDRVDKMLYLTFEEFIKDEKNTTVSEKIKKDAKSELISILRKSPKVYDFAKKVYRKFYNK